MPAPRRAFTAPIQTSVQQYGSSSKSAGGSVDTLYDHPSVKIVSFTAGPRPTFGPRTGVAAPEIEPGSLAWSSQLERTIAVGVCSQLWQERNMCAYCSLTGPFRIYRAPGSVAFLSCGSALQPILPKSQVWCVDEASSKFVLQIRRPQYWRIEIPVAEPDNARRALLLREVFDKILQFEKTECPFKRSFTVELPEPPSTPVKKRPWTPVQRNGPSLPLTPVTPGEMPRILKRAATQLPSATPDSPVSLPERDDQPPVEMPGETPPQVNAAAQGGEETDSQEEQDASPVNIPAKGPAHSNVAKLTGFYASRCVTAPPHLALASKQDATELADVAEEPAEQPTEGDLEKQPGAQSPAESQDSFHSPQSFHSATFPPSPPQSKPVSPMASPRSQRSELLDETAHHEDASDITVISNASQTWSVSPTATEITAASNCATGHSSVCDAELLPSSSSPDAITSSEQLASPPTPVPDDTPLTKSISNLSISSSGSSRSSCTSISTARRSHIRHRATASSSISPSRRALSPLPPAANLFSPRLAFKHTPASTALTAVKRLPMAVIQKTCEILMSPPSHLINLMLKVAARIAAGEWRGLVFGMNERGEQIPVQWDWSDDEDTGAGFAEEDWPPRRKGVRLMAGSFPESDDEDEEEPSGAHGTGPTGPCEEDWSRSLGVD